MNRRRTSLVLAALLLGLAVAGCGSSNDDGAQQNTTPGATTTAPPTPSEVAQPQGQPFTADPTIVGAHPVPFTSWARVADDKIAVNFQTGAPECYGVDAVTTETDTTVTVELRGGTRADAVGRMCVMIAVFGTMEVQLKAPLGDRTVLSAA
ncbi:hypothetical protein [Nocardia amikacinitolerans]|uniref:hypothetical protein n=1 Tax=Nocardia amikacinitolerans TaxID=756689 RepID=UPI0020A26013|nr:hypothetical protein [Nocardia amikacinitolerans]MCP2290909.1 hypothetical protein [Nocardia amikacinitolerans]